MLRVFNLSKSFKKKVIFKNINMKLESGKIYGFIGANGSGKSVFFKVLCGFLKADSGYVECDGKQVGKDIDFIPSLGVVIEKPGFIEHYNHFNNLKYLADIKRKIDAETINSYIELVGLDKESKDPVKNYSLGMRQRLGIAQAIMEDPDVLVLDEPFNGLDKQGVYEIKKIIREMKNSGKLILLTSHIGQDIEELSDCVYEFSQHTLIPWKG